MYCITTGNCARKAGGAGTGNKVAPDFAALRSARPCSFDGRSVSGTAAGDRSRTAALATTPPAAPFIASGSDHPRLVRVSVALADGYDGTGGMGREADEKPLGK